MHPGKIKRYSVIISNNVILWHESEDIHTHTKSLFPKFHLIPISRFQVMHDYVCFIAPIDHCVELSLVDETFCENCSYFILKWFQPKSFCGNVLLRGELQKYAKNSNFDNFESTLYTKSGSMPLNLQPKTFPYVCLWFPDSNLKIFGNWFTKSFIKILSWKWSK